jgi:cystathionine gamma-synthase
MSKQSTAAALPSTTCVHAGEARFRAHNSLTVPVVQTSVYTFDSCEDLVSFTEERMFWDEPEREEYGRYGNPTVRAAEAKIAALEGAQESMLLSSGMAAVTSTLLLLLQAGDHLILTDECYHSTLNFAQDFLPRYGVAVTVVRHGDYAALEAAIRPETAVIFSESPTNPFNHCVDLEQVVALANGRIKTVIDTTFATPLNVRPLDYGIDLVIQSVTKYLGGHNDLMAGAVSGSYALLTPLRQAQGLLGNVVDAHTAYLILRGMKTLGLRVARQNRSALAIARFLEEQPQVRKVWHPGLKSHRDHALAQRTMRGSGGVVSFEIEGDAAAAYRFIDALRIATIGPSLGGVETIVSPLAIMGYANLSPEERVALGIHDELVRLCVGIEDTEDLIADITQALAHV